MSSPHVDDIGTRFEITLNDQDGAVVDISAVTTKEIIFEKPDRTSATKTASFTTDGTDGKMYFIAAGVDLNSNPGNWRIQGHVIGVGFEYRSQVGGFTVASNIP